MLERAGLVPRTVQAQWRTLSLQAEPLNEASAWVEKQRREWNLRLDALEDHLGAKTKNASRNQDPKETD